MPEYQPSNPMNSAPHAENIDPAEIAKFAQLASRWWDPEREFKPLHQINPLRLDFIEKHRPVAGKTVLDVGCGGGILAEGLAQRGAIVTGIDAGEAPLAVAKLHAADSGLAVTYRQLTAEALAAEAAQKTQKTRKNQATQWDIVCCLEMLEHVPDPAKVVAACAKLLKPGGSAYFSTINRNPKAFLFAIIGAEYVLNLLPKGTHDYEKLIRPSELQNWCAACDLRVRELSGLHYNPLTQRYWLGDGVEVNYLMRCQLGGEATD